MDFLTVLKVLSLGVIERGVFLSKNLFQWFDEQSKVDGEAKHHYMQVGHLGSTAKALCLMSNLSDYVYRIIPTLKSRHTFKPTLKTLNTSNSRTTKRAFLIFTISRWKKHKICARNLFTLPFVKEWVARSELFPSRSKGEQNCYFVCTHHLARLFLNNKLVRCEKEFSIHLNERRKEKFRACLSVRNIVSACF